VTFWWLTSLRGRSVALRIAGIADRPRRLVLDEGDPDQIREEWRCASCAGWVASDAVTWALSGRNVGTAPELLTYCNSCGAGPEGRPRVARRSIRPPVEA
jgi:hypothetical protein